MNGFGTIAAVISGYKAGQITENTANRLLRELGCDREVATFLGAAAGLAGGILLGDIIGDAVSDIFEDLF